MVPSLIETILVIVEEFLKLRILKEQDKYADMWLQLKQEYRNEYNKPVWDGVDRTSDASTYRNDAMLAELYNRLCDLATAIATAPRK